MANTRAIPTGPGTAPHDALPEFATMNRMVLIAWSSWVLILTIGGCGSEPQIGANKQVFKGVDALYTAVSLKDRKLVDQCAAELKRLFAAGSVPENASRTLDAIMAEARDGKWEPAQQRLQRFMEGQHR